MTQSHVFLGRDHDQNERRTRVVIALTLAMMVAEIVAGNIFGSMALVADGWHMSTHAAALMIAAFAYRFARAHADDRRFTFGTGKVGDLAAFASAVLLALISILIGWESLWRLAQPVPIHFGEALVVAAIGLAVNLASAWLLMGSHGHGHGHGHDHHHDHGGHDDDGAADHNLRAAYLHVLADALTSVLAIGALLLGQGVGWVWLDPLIGLLGAVMIAVWAVGLIRQTGAVLLDLRPVACPVETAIRAELSGPGESVEDLHVWQLGPGHLGAIVSLASSQPQPVQAYRDRLAGVQGISHLTVEVTPA